MGIVGKKGITIVTLVVTVIILVILTTAVMLTVDDNDMFGETSTTINSHNKQVMIEEIKNLIKSGVSGEFLNTLGLEAKYVQKYLNGEFSSYEEFFEELFKEERHFAKRQQTWYNKEKNIVWLDANDNLFENAKKLIEKFLKN